MKKTLVAIALLGMSGAAAAVDFEAGTITEKNAVPTTFTYTVEADRADRLFVKNAFDFTLSTNVVMNAVEDPNGAFMIVATGNTSGRNVFVGHSNGGSVGVCGDPLTAAEVADDPTAIPTAVDDRFAVDDVTGCTEDVDPS